mmetsp:Transcript_1216/g.3515  ORF Transcript_1216/g.3515 Transcript_1216/m.3515 type:complete len:399 (-) Transcript_1216:144-1340(-)
MSPLGRLCGIPPRMHDRLLDLWVGGHLEDGANAELVAALAAQSDVSIFSPRGTPRVLDEEVWLLSLEVSSVSNGQDPVIDVTALAACVVGEHTSLVELESILVRLDSDGDWLHGDRSQHRLLVALWDIVEGADDASWYVGAVSAASVVLDGLVWVILFRAQTAALFIELECVVHQSSIASKIKMVAIQQVLLRKRNELSSADEFGTLQRAGGGEGPAGPAGTLILDVCHATHVHPVDVVWQLQRLQSTSLGLRLFHQFRSEHKLLLRLLLLGHLRIHTVLAQTKTLGELVGREVGKGVVAHLVCRFLGVVFMDDEVILSPDLESLHSVRLVGVLLVECRSPLAKFRVEVASVEVWLLLLGLRDHVGRAQRRCVGCAGEQRKEDGDVGVDLHGWQLLSD